MFNSYQYCYQNVNYQVIKPGKYITLNLEEIPEDFEEAGEDEEQNKGETLNREYLMGIKISAANKTEEVTLDARTSLKICNVSLSADNKSDAKHILEIAYGPQLDQRHVIARLIPGVVETQTLDIELPPRKVEQTIVFILTGEGVLGDLDVVGTIYDFNDREEHAHEHEHGCDDSNCQDSACAESKSDSYEKAEVVQTLQQKKEALLKNRAIPKPESKPVEQKPVEQKPVDPNAPFNPFAAKAQKTDAKPEPKKEEKKEEKKPEPKKEEENVFRQFKGLQVKDVLPGHGNGTAKHGHKVFVNYRLTLNDQNGRFIEQSKKPFAFTLGRGEVISGWDLGVGGMKVGGKRVLIVPSRLGYGAQKAGNIPPNSTLCFVIDCVDIK
ncbi:Peptidylprolyl_isomerase [Hexamita inflata]|uniref:peptidylprolyl isomerase n=2 Tax=Hexamita inflata TaxID=28002 RepID=A0AA86QYW1_9EUKA|nr:Peptidylprolyl isomerase [Hexamita inflata]